MFIVKRFLLLISIFCSTSSLFAAGGSEWYNYVNREAIRKEYENRFVYYKPNKKFFIGAVAGSYFSSDLSLIKEQKDYKSIQIGNVGGAGVLIGFSNDPSKLIPETRIFNPIGGVEVGFNLYEFTYILNVQFNNTKYSHKDETYDRTIANIFIASNYNFYQPNKFTKFYAGASAGVMASKGIWNYTVLKPSLSTEIPESFTDRDSVYSLLIGANLGMEYRFNNSVAIVVEDMFFTSNFAWQNFQSLTTSTSGSTPGEAVILKREVNSKLKFNTANVFNIKVRWYIF